MRYRIDHPDISVGASPSWRGLVYLGVGTGIALWNITPERADELAAALTAAAAAARAEQ